MTEPKPSNERNGNFLDPQWCCKVCDGEIPDGHLECCDIWKLEKKLNGFIANEYNTALDERDAAQSQLATARERIRQLETRGNELALAADELYEAISENGDSNNAIDARFDAAMAAWLAGGAKEGA